MGLSLAYLRRIKTSDLHHYHMIPLGCAAPACPRGAEATWGTTLASQPLSMLHRSQPPLAVGCQLDMTRLREAGSGAAPCRLCKGGGNLRCT